MSYAYVVKGSEDGNICVYSSKTRPLRLPLLMSLTA